MGILLKENNNNFIDFFYVSLDHILRNEILLYEQSSNFGYNVANRLSEKRYCSRLFLTTKLENVMFYIFQKILTIHLVIMLKRY